jgi:hypothetical protein
MNISVVAHVSTVFDEEEDDELQGANESEVVDTSYDPDIVDTYITTHVLLPCGDDMKVEKVIKRSVDDSAIPKGKHTVIQYYIQANILSSLEMVNCLTILQT